MMKITWKGKELSLNWLYWIIALVTIIILCLPNSIINNTAFYTVKAPSYIQKRDFYNPTFSYLYIFIILFGLLYRKNSTSIRFTKVICAVFLFDIVLTIIFFQGSENLFANNRYEMFLIMLVAETACAVVFGGNADVYSQQKIDSFLDLYFLIGFFTLLMGILQNETIDGRYYMLGLGVGPTGYFSALYLLYQMYSRQTDGVKWLRVTLGLLTLVFSGQRTALFVFLVLCLPFFLNLIVNPNNKFGKKQLLGALAIIIIVIIGGLILLANFSNFNYISRITETFNSIIGGNISSDSSVNGRMESIIAGLIVLKKNPVGIVNDFYALQYRTGFYAFPTFPHSTLLCDALLWTTPITVYCIYFVLSRMIALFKNKNGMAWIVLYIVIMAILWGGPEYQIAPLFIKLFFLSIAENQVKNMNYTSVEDEKTYYQS